MTKTPKMTAVAVNKHWNPADNPKMGGFSPETTDFGRIQVIDELTFGSCTGR